MSNIQAGLDRCLEISKGNWNELCNRCVTIPEVYGILLAMKDDGNDQQFANKYQDVVNRIKQVCNRIEAIESKCGCKVKWKESIEKRIGELEKRVFELEPLWVKYPEVKKVIEKHSGWFDKQSSPSKTEQTLEEVDTSLVADEIVERHYRTGDREYLKERITNALNNARSHQDPSKVSIPSSVFNRIEAAHGDYKASKGVAGLREFITSVEVLIKEVNKSLGK